MPAQINRPRPQSLEFVYRPVLDTLGRLFRQVTVGRAVEADFDKVMFLLETLPLASDDFGTAQLRLTNARRYRGANEDGAAAWEIRTVMNQLRANIAPPSTKPYRRFLDESSTPDVRTIHSLEFRT